jgi:hypothetical protein
MGYKKAAAARDIAAAALDKRASFPIIPSTVIK